MMNIYPICKVKGKYFIVHPIHKMRVYVGKLCKVKIISHKYGTFSKWRKTSMQLALQTWIQWNFEHPNNQILKCHLIDQ
jgi:hypothetical protein